MKSPEIIDRLCRERIMELVIRQCGMPNIKPLPEGFEKFIKGRG